MYFSTVEEIDIISPNSYLQNKKLGSSIVEINDYVRKLVSYRIRFFFSCLYFCTVRKSAHQTGDTQLVTSIKRKFNPRNNEK